MISVDRSVDVAVRPSVRDAEGKSFPMHNLVCIMSSLRDLITILQEPEASFVIVVHMALLQLLLLLFYTVYAQTIGDNWSWRVLGSVSTIGMAKTVVIGIRFRRQSLFLVVLISLGGSGV